VKYKTKDLCALEPYADDLRVGADNCVNTNAINHQGTHLNDLFLEIFRMDTYKLG